MVASAIQWPVPDTIEQAVEIASSGGVCETKAVTVRHVSGQKYDRIVNYQLGPKPPRLDGSDETAGGEFPAVAYAEDEIPF